MTPLKLLDEAILETLQDGRWLATTSNQSRIQFILGARFRECAADAEMIRINRTVLTGITDPICYVVSGKLASRNLLADMALQLHVTDLVWDQISEAHGLPISERDREFRRRSK